MRRQLGVGGFDGNMTGQSTTSMPRKFNAVSRQNSMALSHYHNYNGYKQGGNFSRNFILALNLWRDKRKPWNHVDQWEYAESICAVKATMFTITVNQ